MNRTRTTHISSMNDYLFMYSMVAPRMPQVTWARRRIRTQSACADARTVATAEGRRVGRPILVDAAKFEYTTDLRDAGGHHRRDRHQDRHPPLQPLPSSPAPSAGAGHRLKCYHRIKW